MLFKLSKTLRNIAKLSFMEKKEDNQYNFNFKTNVFLLNKS